MNKKEKEELNTEVDTEEEKNEGYSFPKAGLIICISLLIIVVALIITIYAIGGPY